MQDQGSPFKVAFVQIGCPEYKRAMFEGISKLPSVRLKLFIGDVAPRGHARNGSLAGMDHVPLANRIFRLGGLQIIWQKVNHLLNPRDYDLVILPDGLLYLSNYLLMLRARLSGVPIAFYTHGFNHQRKGSRLAGILEGLRALAHRRAHILIAYSSHGAEMVVQRSPGLRGRCFVALNTLDVDTIMTAASRADTKGIRVELGFSSSDVVLIFIGRISPEKHPEYVVAAVQTLRSEGFPVRALFVGDGPARASLEERLARLDAQTQESIKILGPKGMQDTSELIAASDIVVMPGMTGLAIVHAFAVGRPYVTVESDLHSPEIDYLEPGVNGIQTAASEEALISGLRLLVRDEALRTRMGAAGRAKALAELRFERQMEGFAKAFESLRILLGPRRCER